jgi:hypothetical protein
LLCHDHKSEIWYLTSNHFFEESNDTKVLLVVVTHVTVLAELLLWDDLVICLRNHSNEEVEQNDQVNSEVQKPLEPNISNHEVSLFGSWHVWPIVVQRCTDVSNRVAEGLDQYDYKFLNTYVVLSIIWGSKTVSWESKVNDCDHHEQKET